MSPILGLRRTAWAAGWLRRPVPKDSPVGFNIGGELTYMITPNVAGAFLLRFARANAEFSFEGSDVSMNVGNVQVGAGVRLRF